MQERKVETWGALEEVGKERVFAWHVAMSFRFEVRTSAPPFLNSHFADTMAQIIRAT